MDLLTYASLSVLIIMVWHFSFSTNPKNFGLMQMIGVFILGGAIGWYMGSLIFGLMISFVFSLFFVH